jgi:hypothetical protein
MFTGKDQPRHLRLDDAEIRLFFEHFAHPYAVPFFVTLSARRPHCGSTAGVQEAELDANIVSHAAHKATQGIDFAHQVAFSNSADCGITRHLGDQIDVHGNDCRLQTHAGASMCSLAAGVPSADHDDIISGGHCYTILS